MSVVTLSPTMKVVIDQSGKELSAEKKTDG
jgi:hypothetical protein